MHNYNSVYLPQLHPQAMVPYYRMNEAREQLFGQRNNIKAALEFYLKSHAQNGQKWEKLKTVLYDLIVYIDKS